MTDEYKSGADMWRDYLARYGDAEARGICNRYLDMQVRTTDPEELAFCRELFAAMKETPVGRAEYATSPAALENAGKQYDLGYGFLGYGITVWNRAEEINGDYRTVAHIAPDRTVSIYEKDMPEEVRKRIDAVAQSPDTWAFGFKPLPGMRQPENEKEITIMSGKTIQFIDSDYRELFRIPDGGSIKITYPPDDGRGTITRTCKYRDDHHFETLEKGGDMYHICQFAEIMERIGARYEPEAQLRGAELVPFAAGEEKFFTYNREEGNTCVGHISGDFGNSGDRFYSSWSDRENGRNTPEFQAELHSAVYALRQGLLKDYDSMLSHCQNHPEALLDSGDNYKRYGFKLETDTRQYYTQCFFGEYMRDARFITYAYDKAAPVREQEQPSVLKRIRDAEKSPKPPRKGKTPEKQKGGAEL